MPDRACKRQPGDSYLRTASSSECMPDAAQRTTQPCPSVCDLIACHTVEKADSVTLDTLSFNDCLLLDSFLSRRSFNLASPASFGQ